ncbi:MAG: hypothetical protein K8R91_02140 [Phycisphaerae bacterium]|nr:hypothetical protein [Phycisphaerae bacterium]
MHPKLADIEDRMRIMLDQLDDYLENNYTGIYHLHPNRLPEGGASSPSYDGLFSIFAKFSLGYGTTSGRGYILTIDISTLEKIPVEIREKIEKDAAGKLESMIPDFFPEREIHVTKDASIYKITGDFSLGTA